jgi:uncharacterized membrane protein
VFPLGLLTMVPIFDGVHLATGNAEWAKIAFWMATCGLIGAALAAIFGFVDFLEIPRKTRAYRIALTHLGVNLTGVGLFVVSWAMRLGRLPTTRLAPFIVGLVGFGVLAVGGWLGGELVERLGVGVYDDANVNAPSSLTRGDRHARRPSPQGPVVPREPQPTL